MATQTQQRSMGGRVIGFIGALLRWLIVIVLGIALGIGIYWGGQALYVTVNETMARIDSLEQSVAAEQEAVTNQFAQRDLRFATLEGEMIGQQQRIAQLEPAVGDLTTQVESLTQQAAAAGDAVTELQGSVGTLQSDGQALSQSLDGIDLALFNAEDNIATAQQQVVGLQRTALMVSAQGNLLNAIAALQDQNGGTARDYATRARDTLALAVPMMADGSTASIQGVVDQLTELEGQLEADPFAAQPQLESIWRSLDSLILANLPALEVASPAEAVAPESSEESTE
ncbi:MAG: hypothetical protein KDD73_03445 [Anaerolineales bacterium]|nr:hypothetical protein [Anaerolineales bacterium]MCB9126575.1 hypothetical protein [Ardenticatenales bacterium]MCB9172499.1 hypothetical protein [Ardenticatenales bacterium]